MVFLVILYGMAVTVIGIIVVITEGIKAGVRSGTDKLKRTRKEA